MCVELKLTMPTLLDGLDDKVGKDYGAFPDRLYLIGRDGKIAYKGGPGPFGFKPPELEEAIKEELRKQGQPGPEGQRPDTKAR
jgi:type I thyroxine 5'-deiodinase